MLSTTTLLRAVLCASLLFSTTFLAAQCPATITFNTQSEVTNSGPIFATACSGVANNLIIEPPLVPTLDPIVNLDGLAGFTRVSGDLQIEDNAMLTSVSGLNNLTEVDGTFVLARNNALTTLNGFTGLQFVGSDLRVDGNAQLADLDGFSSLGAVVGDFIIIDNAVLADVDGLALLSGVGSNFTIRFNPSLTNVNGLSNLQIVGAIFEIANNGMLANLDGLTALTEVSGIFAIKNNDLLLDVDGLAQLESVGGNFTVNGNAALTDLDGLGSLQSVGATLLVEDNANLTSVTGLTDLGNVNGFVTLQDNASLNDCTAPIVCTRAIPDPAVKLSISNNTGNCATIPVVRALCTSMPVTLVSFTATAGPKGTDLRWATAGEENSDHFRIERSPRGREWIALGETAAAGTTGAYRNYRFLDATAPTGVRHYYRLAQVDLDGSVVYSDVVSAGGSAAVELSYPNPFTGELILRSEQPDRFSLYATDGRLLYAWDHPGGGALTVRPQLPAGSYWLRAAAAAVTVPVRRR